MYKPSWEEINNTFLRFCHVMREHVKVDPDVTLHLEEGMKAKGITWKVTARYPDGSRFMFLYDLGVSRWEAMRAMNCYIDAWQMIKQSR